MLDFMIRLQIALKARAAREEGQAMVEYALILALVAVVAIGTLQVLGASVDQVFSNINSAIQGAIP